MSMNSVGRPTRPETAGDIQRLRPPDPDRRARPAAGRGADLRTGRLGQDRRRSAGRASDADRPGRPGPQATRSACRACPSPRRVRHYVRLSQKNHAIDLALYPLGSCTMKHNPRLNEKMARLPGFSDIHPAAAAVDGAGRDRADGPPGPLAEDPDRHARRRPVAQGRRPRRARAACWPSARPMRPNGQGHRQHRPGSRPAPTAPTRPRRPSAATRSSRSPRPTTAGSTWPTWRPSWATDVAAIMVTNPNTCGLFERDVVEIARLTHAAGRLLLLRRRQLQRHRRPGAPGRPGRRRHAHQPAQDLLHAARRRRSRRGSGGAVGGPGPVRPGPLGGQPTIDGFKLVEEAKRTRRPGASAG